MDAGIELIVGLGCGCWMQGGLKISASVCSSGGYRMLTVAFQPLAEDKGIALVFGDPKFPFAFVRVARMPVSAPDHDRIHLMPRRVDTPSTRLVRQRFCQRDLEQVVVFCVGDDVCDSRTR